MTAPRRLMVLGARQRSLGWHVVNEAPLGTTTLTVGLTDEAKRIDVVQEPGALRKVMQEFCPDVVVCTVGVNIPRGIASGDLATAMQDSFATNVMGPINALRMALGIASVQQFVVVSSNSAHIARRGSVPYCASKAALSMAIRVAAREMAGGSLMAYGYEFGLLSGTPMTTAIEDKFNGPMSRIPGHPSGFSPAGAARVIHKNIENPWLGLHGTMLRLDGGEQ